MHKGIPPFSLKPGDVEIAKTKGESSAPSLTVIRLMYPSRSRHIATNEYFLDGNDLATIPSRNGVGRYGGPATFYSYRQVREIAERKQAYQAGLFTLNLRDAELLARGSRLLETA